MADIPNPSAATGLELYRFFVELLSPQNLVAYTQGREEYISSRPPSLIRDDARTILLEGTLGDIEANIALVESAAGSPPPIVICIVYPPWGV